MNLNKILKQIQDRQGQIRKNRAELNAEEVRLFRLRDKISEKIEKNLKKVVHS
jgi:hypothetical protein